MRSSLKGLRTLLTELKLKHVASRLEDVLLEDHCADKSHMEFLESFLSVEVEHRRAAAMEVRLRHAGFPSFDKPLKLDGFDFAKRQGITKRQIVELTGNFLWIDKAYNILFFGGSGLGKSFLACYIGMKAIEAGYNVIFMTMNSLAHLLKTEEMLSRSRNKMKRLRNCDLLIIDEVASTVLERQEVSRLYQLLYETYQDTSLIVTANKGFEDWGSALGDRVVTAAVMDRLIHRCEMFNIEGESWRLEDQRSILGNLLKGGAGNAE